MQEKNKINFNAHGFKINKRENQEEITRVFIYLLP